jgi:hypothetical protein
MEQRAHLMISPAADMELRDWLRSAEKNGSSFLKAIAEAASMSNLRHYDLLRPVLLELKKEYPEPD